jgi:glycosyltransferase involved in cell wall biosynthesis
VAFLSNLRFSSQLHSALKDPSRAADFVHVHGLWLMPNIYAGRVAAKLGKLLIVSPRGMVAPAALQYSKWKKRLFWKLFQGPAYSQAACWHATSAMEADEIRAFGIRAPVAVIPNGVHAPDLPQAKQLRDKRSVLSLGRIHPMKGLDKLIAAWTRIAARHPEWELEIIGPDEGGHAAELLSLAARLASPRVKIRGALYGEEKWWALRDADLFILPSLSENFGLTVAESLAAGTPVIASKGTPWDGLIERRCGWWVDRDVEALASALDLAMALPGEELIAMGARGREWIARDFSWTKVAQEMLSVYKWLANAGPRPSTVQTMT